MRKIDAIVMHCTATPGRLDIGVDEIDEWHKSFGWDGVGYHFVVRRDGKVEEGRPIWKAGAHVRGFNAHSIGVVLVGGVAEDGKTPEDNFTEAQIMSASMLVRTIMAQHDITVDRVLGHREVIENITHGSPKACPVFSMDRFRSMLPDRRKQVLSEKRKGDAEARIVVDGGYGLSLEYLRNADAQWVAASVGEDVLDAMGMAIVEWRMGDNKKPPNIIKNILRLYRNRCTV